MPRWQPGERIGVEDENHELIGRRAMANVLTHRDRGICIASISIVIDGADETAVEAAKRLAERLFGEVAQ